MTYFMGIDVSTTSSKALVIDEKGKLVSVFSSPHTLQVPKPLWSEQDPNEWWTAVTNSIRGALEKASIHGDQIAAVGLTGQMHGLVLLDENGKTLRPAILWNDQRTQKQCDEIHQAFGKNEFIRITGNVALTGFTAPKILWVKENEPEVYTRARHVLLPKDFIRYMLTGTYAMDKADGSGTILFDLRKRDWSTQVLNTLDIDPEWMPPTYEGTEITGQITSMATQVTGLKEGTPVVAGGGDQEAGAVGMGAVEPGVIAVTLGTSGVVFAATPSALIEPEGLLHAFCHAVPNTWHFMGVMLSAAGSLQWYHDKIAPELSFDALINEAESIPAGSEGLQFLPYLSGERTPYPDPLARGAFIGLTLRHSRAHMTRAVLEGVAFGLKDSFSLIQAAGLGKVNQVRVAGGGAKSVLWRQILASVLDSPLVTVNTTEGAAFGAALLAKAMGGSAGDVISTCEKCVQTISNVEPDHHQTAVYQEAYQIYHELYPELKESFARLNSI